ncbi:23S rRNA (guanine(1835)-N(2))-methyltransferase, partial [Candidatus Symbiopectobacterium sp. NZEC135]|nr:23S rRNA (guanine(1835)-N(2))-methyltransferase [Candidatus Symbiopectobacterium sp. NZEC135]
ILNDTFGALACGLQAYEPLCVSDSYLSQLATRHNLSLNGFVPESVMLQDSLAALPDAPSLVVIKVPKTLAMLEHQLRMLRAVVAPHTRIIAGAKARDIHTSTLQLFEKIIGPTRTSLAWKKARLIHCDVAQINVGEYSPTVEWELEGYGYRIHNHANVFSRGSLGIGTRFFMQ